MNKLFFAIPFVALIAFSSCKKNDPYNPPTPKNVAPSIQEPDDAQFFFKAIKTFTTRAGSSSSAEFQLGDAMAFLKDSFGFKNNAGVVTVNTLELTNEGNNYVFKSIDNLPGGVTFDTDRASWVVTGDTNTGIEPMLFDDNSPFPSKPVITDKVINTQASFILIAKDTIVADSTIFVINGPSASLRKVRGPNARSVVFTKEEMATLCTGRALGLVQISPYNLVLDTLLVPDTKTYYMKQTVVSKYVDLE